MPGVGELPEFLRRGTTYSTKAVRIGRMAYIGAVDSGIVVRHKRELMTAPPADKASVLARHEAEFDALLAARGERVVAVLSVVDALGQIHVDDMPPPYMLDTRGKYGET